MGNNRENVLAALNHKEPEQLPLDIGGSHFTTLHVSCVQQLREYYGLPWLAKLLDPCNMTGVVEPDLMDILGGAVTEVRDMNNDFGFPHEDWKVWRIPQGMDILVPGRFEVTDDGRGGYYLYPQGDLTAPPRGHMPKNGFYFDAIVEQEEIDDDNLNPEDNLQEFQIVTEEELDYVEKKLKAARATGRAVIANFNGMALGNVAKLPAVMLPHPKGIRTVEEWYISTEMRRDYLKEVFERQTDIALENLKRYQARFGDLIDIIMVCGTDMGTQLAPMLTPEKFNDLYMPYYRKVNDWIHGHTQWKTWKHSCGAIVSLIPSLIEAGFDILNPVQLSAKGMDAEFLKKEFGQDITFWGAAVDTQKVMPFGTPEEVREQVLRRCEILAPGGGFIPAAIHCVQAGTPLKNIIAMVDAVKEFNGK